MKDAKNINQTLQFSNDILVDIEEKLQIYHVKKKIWFLFRVKYKIKKFWQKKNHSLPSKI